MGKWTGRENSATWEVTKQVGPPCLPPGRRRPHAVPSVVLSSGGGGGLPGPLVLQTLGMDLWTTMLEFVSLEKLILKRAKTAAFHL